MSHTSVTIDEQDPRAKSWLDWRLIKVFYNPVEVFRTPISRRDTVLAVVAASAAAMLAQYADLLALDLDLVISEYVAALDIDAAERAAKAESLRLQGYLGPLISLVFVPVGIVAISLFFFFCGYVLRIKPSFKKIFSNVAIVYWPCLAVWMAWAALVNAAGLKELRNGLDLARLAPALVPEWLKLGPLDTIDVFNIWLVALTVIGLVAAGFSKSRAVISVCALWLLYLAFKTSLAITVAESDAKKDCILCKIEEQKAAEKNAARELLKKDAAPKFESGPGQPDR